MKIKYACPSRPTDYGDKTSWGTGPQNMYFNSSLGGPHSWRQHWTLPPTSPSWLSSCFFPVLLISKASRTHYLWMFWRPPRTISILAHTPLNEFQKVHCCCLRRHREFYITFYRFSLLLRTVSWTSVGLQRSAASKVAFTEGKHWSLSPVLSLNRAFNTAQEGREGNTSVYFRLLLLRLFFKQIFINISVGNEHKGL